MLNFQMQNAELQAKHFGQLKAEIDEAMNENDTARMTALQLQTESAITEFQTEFRALISNMGISPAGFYALQYSDFNKELQFIESRLLAYQKEARSSILTRSWKSWFTGQKPQPSVILRQISPLWIQRARKFRRNSSRERFC